MLNGANEEAVRLFLADKIGFYDIFHLTQKALSALPVISRPSLEEILEADRGAREIVIKEHLA